MPWAGVPVAARGPELAGWLEIAIHGWDRSQACGQRSPIPDPLAIDLLAVAPLLIPETGRYPLFDAPVTLAAHAGPGDQLVASLGRNPGSAIGVAQPTTPP